MKKYIFITGASRGLGKAFSKKLLNRDHVLFLISRSGVEGISSKALLHNCRIHDITFDLSDFDAIPGLLSNLFDHVNGDCESLWLLNNAGVTEPVMPIDKAKPGAIEKIVQVNYLAPVLLSSAFIKLAENYKTKKSILNITSGAAHIPHHGMSMYCSTKAAIDQFTKSVALEQNTRDFPVSVHAVSPGFVDTEMLQNIVSKDKSEFGSVDQFKDSRDEGKFADPETVAEKIAKLWLSGKFVHGEVSHISDY